MKKTLLTALILITAALSANAQKKIYIPWEWKNNTATYKESDPGHTAQYSKTRSQESDNFIVYWEKGYGDTHPSQAPDTYRVDIDDLLQKAEWYYALNVGKLAFCDEKNSKVSQYKMIICLLHDAGWVATGSGYDNVIGALWITPSTCKPVGQTIAHEIGHSFQYQTYCDLGGFAGFRTAIGNGSTFWEQTAQWQSVQAHPELKWDQSWFIFKNAHNYAMTHEWMRYQSYWWHYYLAERYGIDIIGRLWRHDTGKGQDPNEVLMSLLGIDTQELFRHYFDYAMKMATIDLDIARSEAEPYIGTYAYSYVPLGGTKFQVAYASCPQTTGFNIIPLDVPEAGTTITTQFTSLKAPAKIADSDPVQFFNGASVYEKLADKTYYNYSSTYNKQRAFRLGYVALLNDGTRQYISQDTLYCAEGGSGNKTASISATIPDNTKRMWLVVVPAPKQYTAHQWDDDITDDSQWPYTIEFKNTSILGAPLIFEDQHITDATITYNVQIPVDSKNYSGITIPVEGKAAVTLATAFQSTTAEAMSKLVSWTSAAPKDGEIKFYALNPTTGKTVNQGPSANGHGHWFNSTGARSDWGSGYVFSELNTATPAFTIGQYPGKAKAGSTLTIGQAFTYQKGEQTATVKFYFNIEFIASTKQATYSIAELNGEYTAIDAITPDQATGTPQPAAIYTIGGTRIDTPQKGINIIKMTDGSVKKVLY